jgi:hypothetical protein
MAEDSRPVSPDTFAGRLSDTALHCRTYGHNWRPRTATWDKKGKAYDVVLVCKCRTERHQLVDPRGGVLANSYVYPDGYLATQVQRDAGLSRDVFRLESVLRYTHQAERRLG